MVCEEDEGSLGLGPCEKLRSDGFLAGVVQWLLWDTVADPILFNLEHADQGSTSDASAATDRYKAAQRFHSLASGRR